jgi:serralysin
MASLNLTPLSAWVPLSDGDSFVGYHLQMGQIIREAFGAIPEAATSPIAFVAYLFVLVAWVVLAWHIRRNRQLLSALKLVPAAQRARVLEGEMGVPRLARGLDPEQWLRARRHLYYLLAFIVTISAMVIVVAIAFAAPDRDIVSDVRMTTTPEVSRAAEGAEVQSRTDLAIDPESRVSNWQHLWPVGTVLRVKFLDGDPAIIARVRPYIEEWSRYANVRFAFTTSDADVRVSFIGHASSAMLGRHSQLGRSQHEPTVYLGSLNRASSEQEMAAVVLHEFGHVLGLLSEQENPNANIVWNKDLIARDLKGRLPFRKRSLVEFPGYREFDPGSVMMEPFPARWVDYRLSGKRNAALSASDKRFIAILYPR